MAKAFEWHFFLLRRMPAVPQNVIKSSEVHQQYQSTPESSSEFKFMKKMSQYIIKLRRVYLLILQEKISRLR